ncbi:hypothetical protein TSL6_12380 [Sulfurovum sp. TSL6]|uniref:ArnT family glycosyltransferase n=1 Tax=Sulfurovum sp. TSL6 TaxID=2826995 RepID=UPI001CC51316|nr:glycosyltransferase family 39 protein [Sulfurovum sp. TSL6]GIU00732.1 hypothetical protein TSL6_12380 [Sulfurovum sp. TSL6]
MMKHLSIPFLILILIAAIGIYFRPIWIIDETRYLSVAWEMWDKGSFLVPLLNGEPYHHKPPFIFWLVHLNWSLLGVNETNIRFIPMLFGFGTLVLAYKLYLTLWKEDIQGAKNTLLILAGTLIFTFYNSLFMFDIILTFWVFLGVFGIVQAVQKQTFIPFVLIALSFGFGVLTKGPVILVHLLPLLLLASYWSSEKVDKRIYFKFLLAFLGGVAIALFWAIPAGIAGGEAYQHAIFWGQTADRMVNSFAHQRAIWWYLALLPLLLFPWSFHKAFYTSLKKKAFDDGLKMLLVWMLSALLIFSFISGKQVHYILPEIAAFSLFCARVLTTTAPSIKNYTKSIGYTYLFFAIVFAIVPFVVPKSVKFPLDSTAFLLSAFLLFALGIYLLKKTFMTQNHAIKAMALSIIVAVFAVHFSIHNFLTAQDISRFSQEISSLQQKGIVVAHDKKYHGQFHFLGRLHDPIIVLTGKEKINKFIRNHPDGMIITYRRKKNMHKINQKLITDKTSFKGKYAILIKAELYNKLNRAP